MTACSLTCPEGQGAVASQSAGTACTSTTDRVCGACNTGRYSDNTGLTCTGSVSMLPVSRTDLCTFSGQLTACSTSCPSGQGAVAAHSAGTECVLTRDRVCGDCDVGRFSATSTLTCSGNYQPEPALPDFTLHSASACSTTCPVGQGAVATQSAGTECALTKDRVCGACDSGRYSATSSLVCSGAPVTGY